MNINPHSYMFDMILFELQDIVGKDYVSTTALQSAPDYDVQEVSRLVKKILQEWDVQEVQALFVKPKQGTVVKYFTVMASLTDLSPCKKEGEIMKKIWRAVTCERILDV